VSILFVDIENFEDVCRGLGPTDILNILSRTLGRVAEVVAQHRGVLLEFIGDEVVAVFGAPAMLSNHSYHCANSAIQINDAVNKMRQVTLEDGRGVKIACKSAVHTATVLAGNMGSKSRLKYGLLGDGVNLTARFKTLNSRYRTRTLATTQLMEDERVLSDFVWRPIDRVAVKGKTEPTLVYELLASTDSEDHDELAILAERHKDAFKCYQSRRFEDAKRQFEDVHKRLANMNRQDEPSKQMIRRCIRLIKNPPGPDWDGVERLNKKVFEIEDDLPEGTIDGTSGNGVAEEGTSRTSIQKIRLSGASASRENTGCTITEEGLEVQPPPEDPVRVSPRSSQLSVALNPPIMEIEPQTPVEKKSEPRSSSGFDNCCRYQFHECQLFSARRA
jgi:class 3 adenylate cyclase